jgi:hypothetical protein
VAIVYEYRGEDYRKAGCSGQHKGQDVERDPHVCKKHVEAITGEQTTVAAGNGKCIAD